MLSSKSLNKSDSIMIKMKGDLNRDHVFCKLKFKTLCSALLALVVGFVLISALSIATNAPSPYRSLKSNTSDNRCIMWLHFEITQDQRVASSIVIKSRLLIFESHLSMKMARLIRDNAQTLLKVQMKGKEAARWWTYYNIFVRKSDGSSIPINWEDTLNDVLKRCDILTRDHVTFELVNKMQYVIRFFDNQQAGGSRIPAHIVTISNVGKLILDKPHIKQAVIAQWTKEYGDEKIAKAVISDIAWQNYALEESSDVARICFRKK